MKPGKRAITISAETEQRTVLSRKNSITARKERALSLRGDQDGGQTGRNIKEKNNRLKGLVTIMKVLLVGEYREGSCLNPALSWRLSPTNLTPGARRSWSAARKRASLRGKVISPCGPIPGIIQICIKTCAGGCGRGTPIISFLPLRSAGPGPGVATALKAGQVSDIISVRDRKFEAGCLNGKMQVSGAGAESGADAQPGPSLKDPGPSSFAPATFGWSFEGRGPAKLLFGKADPPGRG